MAYIDPDMVVAPKNVVRGVRVLYNAGPGEWSAALLDWNGEEVIALRWNGDEGNGIGNPQSRGKPTWFVVPSDLAQAVRQRVEELMDCQEGGLLAGYRAMAEDQEREREAQEWSEGLIGDAGSQER